MPKNPGLRELSHLIEALQHVQSGKKVNVAQMEDAIDRCERAIRASLKLVTRLRREVRQIEKEQTAKPKGRKV